jgi:hypothetical protein
MRNLPQTINQILKIEPALEAHLVPIKLKWEKSQKNELYWKKLIKILNSKITPEHPKRNLIQGVFNSSQKIIKKSYTFEPPSSMEIVIGVIPENLEGKLRKLDRQQIECAKETIEAKMTHSHAMITKVLKKSEQLDIEQKQFWLKIKSHFNLWDRVSTPFFIRIQDNNLLVLTALKGPGNNPDPVPNGPPGNFFVRMDEDTFKRFFKFINPSGVPPFSENE